MVETTRTRKNGAPRAARSPVPPKGWQDYYDPGGRDLFDKARAFQTLLRELRAEGSHFFRRPLLGASRAHARVKDPRTGRPVDVLMFGTNSYLGLNADPRVVAASIRAAERYGYGSGSVSLYAGTTDLHLELERRIANFYRCEDAILFPTGYAANVGTISAIVRPRDHIVSDMFNHASIHDGCALSGATVHTYAHRNMRRLERTLQRLADSEGGILVVTDGVFSMEGDVAPLDRIVELASAYGARVMIDEAHATGVVGATGRGTAELFGVEGRIDLTLGTLSKVPGAIGGYVAGSREVIDYLRYYASTYFFSTSLPAPVVAGLIEVFRILEEDGSLHRALWNNIRRVKTRLLELGFDVGRSESAIVPVIVRDDALLKRLLRDLWNEGIFVNYVAYPAVPRNRCRLRMGITAQHSPEDLDRLLETLERLGRRHGIID